MLIEPAAYQASSGSAAVDKKGHEIEGRNTLMAHEAMSAAESESRWGDRWEMGIIIRG